MLFSSLEFLFLYLPITVIIYFAVPLRFRNFVLLIVSLIFYGWGEPLYVFLMIFTIVMDYIFGIIVGKHRHDKSGKIALILSIISNLMILSFFKYCDFFIINLSKIPFLSSLEPLGITMPIGISFYTFQALSYVIDVYRGDTEYQNSIISFGAYVTLFPQLIAGPIVRYKDVDKQLLSREHSFFMASSGARTFMCGLAKKILIANVAGEIWASCQNVPFAERSAVCAWIGIIFYMIQIYFDFSGYSDMAIGLGKIFGFTFLENFNYPYTATSITDFWRRWHISLSSWFKEYVYIPLGGNRKGKARTYLNLFIVWFLTGFWHGSNWNFIIWGLYYFVLLVIEKTFLSNILKKIPKVLSHIYTLFFVLIGWLIFVFEDSSAGLDYLKTMLGMGAGFVNPRDLYTFLRLILFAAVSVLGATPIPKKIFIKAYSSKNGEKFAIISACASLLLLIICSAYLADSSFNPFLYWNF